MRPIVTICAGLPVCAVVAAALAGCETEGFSIGSALTGQRQSVYIPEAAAAAADSEVTTRWERIVIGTRPYHRAVGYLETREFTPAGTHDAVQIQYVWPDPFDLSPWGFVTAEGGAYRYPLDAGESEPEALGHMPIETACCLILGVCEKCGHELDREVVHAVARADLGAERARDFRHFVVDNHRASRDLHQTQGTALHQHTGGGVTLDHACEECRDKAVPALTGVVHSLRVQFEELTAADLAPAPVAAPAAPPAGDGGDESGEDSGDEG